MSCSVTEGLFSWQKFGLAQLRSVGYSTFGLLFVKHYPGVDKGFEIMWKGIILKREKEKNKKNTLPGKASTVF